MRFADVLLFVFAHITLRQVEEQARTEAAEQAAMCALESIGEAQAQHEVEVARLQDLLLQQSNDWRAKYDAEVARLASAVNSQQGSIEAQVIKC
jgi:sirohydrochlorin ferrochelatase